MPTVKVGDVNLYYETHGRGDPLLMIPGFAMGSTASYFRQIPGLAEHYRVIALDNRGGGLSDKPDIRYSMETMADDASAVLDALDVHRAHIFGLSMGGMIAQHLALRHPKVATSLILAATSCGGKHSTPPDAEYAASIFNTEGTVEERIRRRLHFLFTQEFMAGKPNVVEDFLSLYVRYAPPFHTYIRHLEASIMHDAYDRLPELNLPTLVIVGSEDKAQPPENSEILASRIPKAELVFMNGQRHYLSIECPDRLNTLILDFLKRHPIVA
jgi:pimeloyl-ACP methyl ester carboxylesterase